MHKSRFTKENSLVEVRLSFTDGLSRYYGLVDLAVKYGIFKQVSTRIELPDGTKTFAKTINGNPEKFFTEDVLKQLDDAALKEYSYQNGDLEYDDREDDTIESAE
jgi:hypothetical protein